MAGGWLGLASGLSPGGAIILASMAASASYIATPAAIKVGILEANTGMAVTTALGITFPFNLAIGIPFYTWWVERLAKFLKAPARSTILLAPTAFIYHA